jgi:flagellar biosynthesis protein FlhG
MRDQAASMRALARTAVRNGRHRPHVLTVTSGKGGVGKSTIALNLAVVMGTMGRPTLLVDADANLGSADLALGLAPTRRLGDVLRGACDVQDALLRPFSGMALLPGSSGEADYPMLSGEDQRRLIDELQDLDESPELVVIDTGAGLSPEVIGYAELADTVLVVTRVEPTAVLDAYAMIKVLLAGKPDARVQLLVNGVRSPEDADQTAQKLQAALRHFVRYELEYAGFVPEDPEVVRALERRRPVVEAYPGAASTLSLKALAVRFADSCAQNQRIAV